MKIEKDGFYFLKCHYKVFPICSFQLLLPKRKYQPFSIFQQGTDKSLSQVKFALLNYKYAMQFFLLNNNLVHVQHRCNFSIRNLHVPKVYIFLLKLRFIWVFYVSYDTFVYFLSYNTFEYFLSKLWYIWVFYI